MNRYRCGEQSRFGKAALNETIELKQLLVVAAKTRCRSRFKSGQPPQQILRRLDRSPLQLITPEATIRLKWNEQSTFNPHQTRSHDGHKLEKALEVGEAAEGKPQGDQQVLVAALFAAEAVKQLAQ
jgi:hypothetical protein